MGDLSRRNQFGSGEGGSVAVCIRRAISSEGAEGDEGWSQFNDIPLTQSHAITE